MRFEKLSEVHALVLHSIDYRDSDKILTLLTAEFGKIPAIALKASRSKRRFTSSSLEPLSHVKVLLNRPLLADHSQSGSVSSLWRLESATLQTSFLGLRRSLNYLRAAALIACLISDTVPEAHPDPSLFKNFGRYLRALSSEKCSEKMTSLLFYAFGSWLSAFVGYGPLIPRQETLRGQLSIFWDRIQKEENFWDLWVENFPSQNFPSESHLSFQQTAEIFYQDWLRQTSFHSVGYQKNLCAYSL